ncbi:MAG: DNA (cytosine-5-)-methyltransferase [Alphaproteobacteria bacterium]|nr:DNA (cytosine-5-)-methyltransferase [Alphaproteobacteria bacterium]
MKVGSFFAGLGGICLGFKNAGFDLVWSNEIDAAACKTYRANFDHVLVEGDICALSPDDKRLKKVDIITGGFPCQAFSIAGYRKGFEDERGRGKLFFEMLRFIKAYKPKVLFFENVRNLQSHNNGETYKAIEKALTNLGYHVCSKVLDTCEYSRVPQHRERFYMVCFKSKRRAKLFDEIGWPKKVPASRRYKYWDIVNETADEIHYFNRYPHYYKPAMETIEATGNDCEAFYQWRRVYCRKNKNGVCPTLTANMGGGGHNVPLVMDKKDLRRLTPEECLKLQGFDPDTFKFPDDVSLGNRYKQIGNAVSVPVVEEIAKGILKVLSPQDKKTTDGQAS